MLASDAFFHELTQLFAGLGQFGGKRFTRQIGAEFHGLPRLRIISRWLVGVGRVDKFHEAGGPAQWRSLERRAARQLAIDTVVDERAVSPGGLRGVKSRICPLDEHFDALIRLDRRQAAADRHA